MMLLHGALNDHADWALYLALACTFACAIWAIRSSGLTRVASTADAIPLGLMGLGQLALPHLAGSIVEGLSFYPLLTALSALMFGFRYSFLLAMTVQLMNVWAGLGELTSIGISLWITHWIPACWTLGLLAVCQRYLPRNLFVYLLLNGFFGASLAMIWVQFGATGILLALSDLSWAYLKQYYLPFGLMLSFPEGFITGAFLTMLVLFQPQWVYTFRDEVYQLKS